METYIVGLALLIFLGLVFWKGRKAIANGLDHKIAQIRAEIEEASSLREEAERLFAENKKLAESASDEEKAIIVQAQEEAKRSQDTAIAAFEANAERRRAQAQSKIAQAEAEALRAVRAEAASVAILAAREVISSEMANAKADSSLDSAIDELPSRLS
jgi:F-type H+-transporting ATPase subunit b